jgi:ribonuclease E
LRDLGGLIVVDFIDMRAQKNVRQVEKAVKDAMKPDKARYDITRLSRLGLMEISRERLNPQKASLRYTDCPSCKGTGSIKTVEAAAMQALRKLQTRVVRGDLENIEVVLPSDVAEYIANNKRRDLVSWEERYQTRILVHSDSEMGRDDSDLRTVLREKTASSQPLLDTQLHGQILAEIDRAEAEGDKLPEAAVEGQEGAAKKKRRRRRKKKSSGAAAEDEAVRAQSPDETAAEQTPPAAAEAAAEDKEDEGNGEAAKSGKRKRRRRRRKKPAGAPREEAEAAEGTASPEQAAERPTPPLAAALTAPDELPPGAAPRPRWWQQLLDL